MVAAARERGRSLAVNFNHRFTPAALAARRWLDGGELGERLFCNMALWIGRAGAFETPNYHLKALDPHAVNMMEWFCGPIEAVQAFAVRASGRNFWSTASINVRFVCGAVGHLTSSYDIERGHPMERCEVAGAKGRFVVEDMWREATLYPAGNPEKRVVTNPVFGGYRDFDDTFAARLHRFLEQVAAGDPPERIDGSGADGVRTTEVIHAAIRSLDEGNRAVRVDEMA
jgi:predicted dehydrogenase